MTKATKQIRVTQTRSTNKRLARHKACITGLGLHHIGHTVTLKDTPQVRGMIDKVSFMVRVEDA